MKQPDYARLKAVYLQASELEGRERERFLETATAGQGALLARLRDLFGYEHDPRTPADAIGAVSAAVIADTLPVNDPIAPMPEQVGGYRIIRTIGRGGMGIVYEAEQTQPRRRVAVKVLPPGLLSSTTAHRFELEAALLGRLQHPGIAGIIEARVGAGEDVPFMAMEFVDGVSLSAYAADAAPSLEARLRLLSKLCEATHHAHTRGVIHRDLKPGNILVTADGSPKILDFGIGRALGDDPGTPRMNTIAGEVLGTVNYMSPEQASGDPDAVDVRSDVYALGVIGYQFITGHLPHDLNGMSLPVALATVQSEPPASPSRYVKHLPRDVSTILMTALEAEKDRRYQTAAALGSDIERFLRRTPILARPPSALYQLRLFTIRRKAAAIAGLAIAVTLVLAVVVSLSFAIRAERSADDAHAESVRAHAATSDALMQTERAGRAAYVAQIRAASSAVDRGRGSEAARLLGDTEPSLRGWEWSYLTSRLDTCDFRLGESEQAVGDATFSCDGRFVLTATRPGEVAFRGAADFQIRKTVQVEPELESMDLSADGRQLVTGHGTGRVAVLDLASGARRTIELPITAGHVSVRFSPAGDRVVLMSAEETRLWNPESGECVPIRGGAGADFSPDGSLLVHAAWADRLLVNGAVMLSDGATGRHIGRIGVSAEPVRSVAFAPDGARVAVGTKHPGIQVIDRKTEKRVLSFRGRDSVVSAIAWSRDGRFILTGTDAGSVDLWRAGDGSHARSLLGHDGQIVHVAASPDGTKVVAATASSVRMWDLSEETDAFVGRGHESYVYEVAFSPDDRNLATLSWDGTARMWCPWTALPRGVLADGLGGPRGIAWSRDGSHVLAAVPNVHSIDVESGAISSAQRTPDPDPADVAWPGQLHDCSIVPDRVMVRISAAASRRTLVVTDLASGKNRTLELGFAAAVLTLTRDGRLCAVAGADSVVRIFELSTLAQVAELRELTQSVYALAFSPDGARLAGGGRTGEIHLWSTESWKEVAVLDGHSGDLRSLSYSADGTRLASASADRTIRIWSSLPRRVLVANAAASWQTAPRDNRGDGQKSAPAEHAPSGAASAPTSVETPIRKSIVGEPGTLFGECVLLADLGAVGWRQLVVGAPGQPPMQSGAVDILDSRTFERIRRVSGEHAGDAFGSTLANVLDVDGDGHPDLAVGAPGFDGQAGEDAGAVLIVSGATGLVLRTIEGQAADERIGSTLASIDDLDGDGVREIVVSARGDSSAVRVISAKSGAVLRSWRCDDLPEPFHLVGDVDGDRVKDVAVIVENRIEIISLAKDHALARISLPPTARAPTRILAPVSDVDGDGIPDFVIAHASGPMRPNRDVSLIGSALGQPIWTRQLGRDLYRTRLLCIDDQDGDGSPDVAIQSRSDGPQSPRGVRVLRVLSGKGGGDLFSLGYKGSEPATVLATGDPGADGSGELLLGLPHESPPAVLILTAPAAKILSR